MDELEEEDRTRASRASTSEYSFSIFQLSFPLALTPITNDSTSFPRSFDRMVEPSTRTSVVGRSSETSFADLKEPWGALLLSLCAEGPIMREEREVAEAVCECALELELELWALLVLLLLGLGFLVVFTVDIDMVLALELFP